MVEAISTFLPRIKSLCIGKDPFSDTVIFVNGSCRNFYLDFGPLNLGMLYRFCVMVNSKLNDPKLKDKEIYYYSGHHAHKRANAMFLMSAWSVLFMRKTPEDAFKPFRSLPPVPSWHDASPGPCPFQLTIVDTLKGLLKAAQHKFFDFNNFNLAEYEHFEQVENGDLNWCVENKFVMFAGPQNKRESTPEGYHSLSPEDLIPYFKRTSAHPLPCALRAVNAYPLQARTWNSSFD